MASRQHVIARRNLIWSIATMHVAFSIWYLWSVMVLFMPQSVYGCSTGDKLLVGDIAGFIALFIFCGVGKGSVFELIPSVFAERSRALELDNTECRHWERVRSAALIGFAGSFGALGGMVINLALRESYTTTGTETPAFWAFMICYVAAAFLTWTRYVRPQRSAPEAVAEQPVSS